MKKLGKSALFLMGLLGSSTALAGYSNSVDDRGCWDGRTDYGGECISETSEWQGERLRVRYTNNCNHRVYMKFCNERNSGSWDCGASGVGAGRTHTWSTNNASGNYRYIWIGSVNGSKDWVCNDDVSGWDTLED